MYKNLKRNRFKSVIECKSDYGTTDEVFKTLGDKIVECSQYGADIGSSVKVDYDTSDVVDGAKDSHDVDIMSSPNVDFFDIYEESGHMVEVAGPPSS